MRARFVRIRFLSGDMRHPSPVCMCGPSLTYGPRFAPDEVDLKRFGLGNFNCDKIRLNY